MTAEKPSAMVVRVRAARSQQTTETQDDKRKSWHTPRTPTESVQSPNRSNQRFSWHPSLIDPAISQTRCNDSVEQLRPARVSFEDKVSGFTISSWTDLHNPSPAVANADQVVQIVSIAENDATPAAASTTTPAAVDVGVIKSVHADHDMSPVKRNFTSLTDHYMDVVVKELRGGFCIIMLISMRACERNFCCVPMLGFCYGFFTFPVPPPPLSSSHHMRTKFD